MTNDNDPPDVPPPLLNGPLRPDRAPLWGRIAFGFLPAVLLLLLMFFCFTVDRSGDTLLPFLLAAGVGFVVLTPLVLIPWSSRVVKAIHGPAVPGKQGARVGMIALITMGMTFANFFVVFAGCCAILMTLG